MALAFELQARLPQEVLKLLVHRHQVIPRSLYVVQFEQGLYVQEAVRHQLLKLVPLVYVLVNHPRNGL